MKQSVTAALVGFVIPFFLAGAGCVDLKRPEEVENCASSKTEPCTNDQRKDAAPHADAAVIDSGGTTDAAGQPDLPAPDGKEPADLRTDSDSASPDRADTAANGPDTAADAVVPGFDGGQQDMGIVPDAAVPADGPDAAGRDTPGPDLADAANRDTNPPPMDAGPSVVTTFSNGKGVGLMTGYGWVSMGSGADITSPTCQSGVPITASTPCASGTLWNPSFPTALCLSGTLQSVSAVPTNNWGIQLGVNASGTSGIGQSFRTVRVNAVGVPTTETRIAIHRNGDPEGDTYCATWTGSTTAVDLLSFNKACWDNTGVFLSAADIPRIDKIGLQVLPLQAQSIPLANLCLQSITFGN